MHVGKEIPFKYKYYTRTHTYTQSLWISAVTHNILFYSFALVVILLTLQTKKFLHIHLTSFLLSRKRLQFNLNFFNFSRAIDLFDSIRFIAHTIA